MSAAIHHRSPTDAPRVVITGFGAVTCLGTDAGSTWEAMREGRSGVSHYGTGPFAPISDKWPTTIAGEVKDLDLSSIMDSREAKRLDRYTQFGMLAAHEAVGQSGIDFSKVDPVRAGVVIGSGVGGIATIEEGHSTLLKKGPTRVSPFTVPRLMANATTGNVSIRYGLRGPASAHATACASSGHAIQDAMGYIRRGYCDVMLSGGAEAAITPVCVSAFSTMKALSTRNDDPTRASRPFDQDRDGFVLGEGAGILVLESEAHARARGATIYAEQLGV
ncbi:MAG: beta-ketoacyl synthase N-terminal-like domain-containing protein, partial [Planctomycetota bacterium]